MDFFLFRFLFILNDNLKFLFSRDQKQFRILEFHSIEKWKEWKRKEEKEKLHFIGRCRRSAILFLFGTFLCFAKVTNCGLESKFIRFRIKWKSFLFKIHLFLFNSISPLQEREQFRNQQKKECEWTKENTIICLIKLYFHFIPILFHFHWLNWRIPPDFTFLFTASYILL